MIKATSQFNGPPFSYEATVGGCPIYLDNFSIIDLATGDPSRRKRFVEIIKSGADLLFSIANAVELTGSQGRSLEEIKAFLDEIGRSWFPVELDPEIVVKRELNGATGGESFISGDFLKAYFADRTANCLPNSGRIIDLSEDFFRLGKVLDWLGPQRTSIRNSRNELDAKLFELVSKYGAEFERDGNWPDINLPAQPFNQSKPATFVYYNLLRNMILEAKYYHLKKGDYMDFCHAVMACAFACCATLDKHWKRRAEGLPKPNKIARIYYGPELDNMLTEIESWLSN